jgi:hypothetical protein
MYTIGTACLALYANPRIKDVRRDCTQLALWLDEVYKVPRVTRPLGDSRGDLEHSHWHLRCLSTGR